MNMKEMISFETLSDLEEIDMISELGDFFLWYRDNKTIVDKAITASNKQVDDITLIDFWMENIGKSEKIEKYLDDINVIADAYEFAKHFKDRMMQLIEKGEKCVYHKDYYRTHEQAKKLRTLLGALEGHYKYDEIMEYFKAEGYDVDHINKIKADKLIKRCSQILNEA